MGWRYWAVIAGSVGVVACGGGTDDGEYIDEPDDTHCRDEGPSTMSDAMGTWFMAEPLDLSWPIGGEGPGLADRIVYEMSREAGGGVGRPGSRPRWTTSR